MITRFARSSAFALAAVVAVLPSASFAEDGGEATDIIVTANKRAERLQDVPIAVSTVSGDSLAASHVTQAEDKELPTAPSFSMTGGIDLKLMDNDSGKLVLSDSGSYASSQFFEIMNVERLKQRGYALFNAHLDWVSADGRWNAALWGRNLGQKFYTTAGIDLSGFGFDYKQWGTPRTYGMTVVGTSF